MKELIEKASVLLEALPYIRRFQGKVFVLKYGGHAMLQPALRDGFARDVSLLKLIGVHPVIVHGGGPQIDETLAAMGVVSDRIDGLRVTDERTMGVVEMVLGGKLNQEIVSLICRHGGRAIGMSGKDDAFLRADKVERMRTKKGEWVDPGRVGAMRAVKTEVLEKLLTGGFIPVIAPIAVDEAGDGLNVNADFVAAAVAGALSAEKLVLMTDIAGVKGKDGALLASLTRAEVHALEDDGTISGGMIPKVRCALDAIDAGVRKVHVVDGRTEHAVLLEIFTDKGVGTEIVG